MNPPNSARIVALSIGMLAALSAPTQAAYVNFEAGHVRPIALSPDADILFAVNTPDNQLSLVEITDEGMHRAADIPVGLRPVAVAVRDTGSGLEAWVVNHLSDSVSVVEIDEVDLTQSRVVKTLLVGDEPRDIVFGAGNHAFITTARRGQHSTVPSAALKTDGIGRALVWVFNANATGGGMGGTPVNVIELFTDTPRGLAVSPDGSKVYAAGHRSGNQTTAISEGAVASGGGVPPMPPGATAGEPDTSLILKFNASTGNWEDELGGDWSSDVPFDLPDLDVFVIDATKSPPALADGANTISGVGTILYNLAVRPSNGKVYSSNLEFRNHIRFENLVGVTQGIQGHVAENQITVIDGTTATPIHLNPHIDYSVASGSASEIAQSLAMPLDMVFDSTGQTVFIAAFGSAKVAALSATSLEAGSISGDLISVAGGPSGLALDETRDHLYVMSRFDNRITAIQHPANSTTRAIVATVDLPTPEPSAITAGRPLLYDAAFSSGHGDASCATCHIFGDMDKMAWDLGNPFGTIQPNINTDILDVLFGIGQGLGDFHPLKGPMTTQSLRGLVGQGPLHWRGDKTNVSDEFDDVENLKGFSEAFVTLLGRPAEPSPAEFAAFSDFVLTLAYPPNPIRALSNLGTATEIAGQDAFENALTGAGVVACAPCHALPTGTNGFTLDINGMLMGAGSQAMKIPHLRNMYDKVGAFGLSGDQVSGFGFLHDGTEWSMEDFLSVGFTFTGSQKNDINDFQMAVDTGQKPVVGQQVAVDAGNFNDPDILARISLLVAQADAGNADLVVKGANGGSAHGAAYIGGGSFQIDQAGEPNQTADGLRTLAATAGQEQVFTAVPVGTSLRIGIDRDEDAFLDFDDNCPGISNDQTDTDSDGIGDPCDATPVPEPAALLALIAGLPLLRWMSVRRRGSN